MAFDHETLDMFIFCQAYPLQDFIDTYADGFSSIQGNRRKGMNNSPGSVLFLRVIDNVPINADSMIQRSVGDKPGKDFWRTGPYVHGGRKAERRTSGIKGFIRFVFNKAPMPFEIFDKG